MRPFPACLLGAIGACAVIAVSAPAEDPATPASCSWHAPDRAAKVAALIPGRRVPLPSPAEFMAEWTRQRIAAWEKTHPPVPAAQAYEPFAKTAPTDDEIRTSIPDHISPYGRLVSGKADPEKASKVMLGYCPFCGHRQTVPLTTFADSDPANPYHVKTRCCRRDIYERDSDYPPGYELKPNGTATFPHLDGTVKEVPSYTFTDKDGATWELYLNTVVAYHRWIAMCWKIDSYLGQFRQTGDPLAAHKLAALLDRVSEVYYGLPLAWHNETATGKDGKPLTREEWEAVPRPVISGMTTIFGTADKHFFKWDRSIILGNRGWLLYHQREARWSVPFASVRHHPAFKEYSRQRYGDPEALDRKIMEKLIRELKLVMTSFPLAVDPQYGYAPEMLALGILTQDKYIFDFAASHEECVLYNHHYHDGMNGEGAANYMTLLNGFYDYMANPDGWLMFVPDFLRQNPFFERARTQLRELYTVRGLPLEFGDQYIPQYDAGRFLADPAKVAPNEMRPSMNWPGYGIGILRVGGPGHRQEVFMTYDRPVDHSASDKLGIECWVDGVPVMREGGYGPAFSAAFLDPARPEIKALFAMPYPRPIFEAGVPESQWWSATCWVWSHAHCAHNTLAVNELGTGLWGDMNGFGDLITFKGGEAPGEPGAAFQVLDARDVGSFDLMGVKTDEFRCTLLGIEGPDGRPYAVDILRVSGGQRHALFQSACADPVEENLPPVTAEEPNYAAHAGKLRGVPVNPEQKSEQASLKNYAEIRPARVLSSAKQWGLTWKVDYAAYAPFDAEGHPRPRPLPPDVGLVRLRLIGLSPDGKTNLVRGKGPWFVRMNQPLPNGTSISQYVGFRDAWDFLIESRKADSADTALKSCYVHVLEGFREGEESAIRSLEPIPVAEAACGPDEVVALRLTMTAGHTDTVIFQPAPGKVRLTDGIETDAQYTLVRRDDSGQVTAAHFVRGNSLTCGKFAATTTGEFSGTIADIIGDLSGTRQESALIIRPDKPWPAGKALAGRQIALDVINNHQESYTIQSVSARPDGAVRVDLANAAPFALGWYHVMALSTEKRNSVLINAYLQKGIKSTIWQGCKAWFPERGQTFTIEKVDGNYRLDFREDVDLNNCGIQPGDWLVVCAVEPGRRVCVPGDFAWKQVCRAVKPDASARALGRRSCLRSADTATVSLPAANGALWSRIGSGAWQQAAGVVKTPDGALQLTLAAADTQGEVVRLIADKPEGLKLEDSGPPKITRVAVDDRDVTVQPELALGSILSPKKLMIEARDEDNPIDLASLVVTFDGKRIEGDRDWVEARPPAPDGKALSIVIDLSRLAASDDPKKFRYHRITLDVDDIAVDDAKTALRLTYLPFTPRPNVVYLSDLQEASAVVRVGLIKDRAYEQEQPISIRGVTYAKGVITHPVYEKAFAEVIYDLPQTPPRKMFRATAGIDDAAGGGSAAFQVQVMKQEKWETVFSSPVLRGGQAPVEVSVDITGVKKLKLYCTDAGDGVWPDHATWADARLE